MVRLVGTVGAYQRDLLPAWHATVPAWIVRGPHQAPSPPRHAAPQVRATDCRVPPPGANRCRPLTRLVLSRPPPVTHRYPLHMLDVILLGTGGTIPLPGRALSALLVRAGPDLILFDCGEGTQVSMRRVRLGLQRLSRRSA